MNNLLSSDYQKIFPENLKKYKNLKVLAIEFEKNYKKYVISEIEKLAIYENLELQSNEVLSELAWQFQVENYSEFLTKEQKITLIKGSIHQWRTQGTKGAVAEGLSKIGYPVKIKEWFEYGGKPFTFKIEANFFIPNEDLIKQIREIVYKYKNSRSVLENIEANPISDLKFIKINSFSVCTIERTY